MEVQPHTQTPVKAKGRGRALPQGAPAQCCCWTLAFSFVAVLGDLCSGCRAGLCFVNRAWYSSWISGKETCSSWASIISSSSSVLMTRVKDKETQQEIFSDKNCTDNEEALVAKQKMVKDFKSAIA